MNHLILWSRTEIYEDADRWVGGFHAKVKRNLFSGKTAGGRSMPNVSQATMKRPIKSSGRWSDKRIRSEVNNSADPIHATGQTINSISKFRKGKGAWEISPTGARARTIISENYNPRVRKPARRTMDFDDNVINEAEDAVIASLKRAIGGF